MNSQQQQWSSEEDKVDSAVSNTYTTLAINPGNSELPPSPSTPIVSSFFSTEVDPKWEFPRENIQLTDVLHEGQFTILYKGTIKGIKERMIEVAVKSVRGKSNICDNSVEKGALCVMWKIFMVLFEDHKKHTGNV